MPTKPPALASPLTLPVAWLFVIDPLLLWPTKPPVLFDPRTAALALESISCELLVIMPTMPPVPLPVAVIDPAV